MTRWAGWPKRTRFDQLGRAQQAYESVLTANERFPEHTLILFNLAIYSAKLGNNSEAEKWLREAEQNDDGQLEELLSDEPDLQALAQRI